MVAVILLIPFFIGCCFNIIYFADTEVTSSRAKLFVSCILVIISVLCLAFWNIFYIVFLYKYPIIQTELGPILTKKAFVVWSLYLATCFAFLWGYFCCVCKSYHEATMSDDEKKEYEENKNKPMFELPKVPGVPGIGKKEEEAKDDMAMMDAMM